MMPVGLILILILILVLILIKKRNKENFPPGPTNLPIIGSALHLSGGKLLKSFNTLREKYGNFCFLRIGPIPCLIISDHATVEKIFKSPVFTPRPLYLTEVMGNFMQREGDFPTANKGVVFSSDKTWDENRKFLLRKLSEFGMGKSGHEQSVIEQADHLVEDLRVHAKSGPVNLLEKFNIPIINSLWKMVANTTFSLNDQRILRLYRQIEYFIGSNRLIGLCMVFPWLRHFTGHLGKTGEKLKTNIRDLMKETVDNHLLTYNEDHERDLVDSYLTKIKETQDPLSSFFGHRGRTNLEQNLVELFGAGANPVSTTLSFCFYFMAKYPDIQSEVVAEIEENVGTSTVLLEHRQALPLTNSFLHEVLRITAINFIGTPHMNTEKTQIHGYTIPAGTTVFAFLARIMNDEEYWDKPKEFRHNRFIVNGKFVKDERLIPFGVGRRQCLGMQLANTQLFLFLTNIIQKLKFCSHPLHPLPPPIPTDGFVMGCPRFSVKIESRN